MLNDSGFLELTDVLRGVPELGQDVVRVRSQKGGRSLDRPGSLREPDRNADHGSPSGLRVLNGGQHLISQCLRLVEDLSTREDRSAWDVRLVEQIQPVLRGPGRQ